MPRKRGGLAGVSGGPSRPWRKTGAAVAQPMVTGRAVAEDGGCATDVGPSLGDPVSAC